MQRQFFSNDNTTKAEVYDIIKQIVELIISTQLPIVVSYSAGKDSSVALGMFLRALRVAKRLGHHPKHTAHVVLSDTQQETFLMRKLIKGQIAGLEDYTKRYKLPVAIHRITPPTSSKFWSMVIGSGLTFNVNPDQSICTDRMKIAPVGKLLESIIEDYNGYLTITGSRSDESAKRAENNGLYTIKGHLKSHQDERCQMFTAIEDFSVRDVWSYLYKNRKQMWWSNYDLLQELYADISSSAKECKTIFEGEAARSPGCKMGRAGCLVCPKASPADRSLQNMTDTDKYPYLGPINAFRDRLMGVERCSADELEDVMEMHGGQRAFRQKYEILHQNIEVIYKQKNGFTHWTNRDVYNHKNHRHLVMDTDGERNQQTLPGGWSLDYRKKMFKDLLETSRLAMELGADEHLISVDEIEYIATRWLAEGDHELSAIKWAREAGFDVVASKEQLSTAILVKQIKRAFEENAELSDENNLSLMTDRHFSDRYYAQVALELQKKKKKKKNIYATLAEMLSGSDQGKALFLALKVNTVQFHPSPEQEEVIKTEWRNDQAHALTLLSQHEAGNRKVEEGLFGTVGRDNVLSAMIAGKDIMETDGDLNDFYALMEFGGFIEDESESDCVSQKVSA